MQESRKSLNTDPERVWLIVDWFFSDEASHIRSKVEDVRTALLLLPFVFGYRPQGTGAATFVPVTITSEIPEN